MRDVNGTLEVAVRRDPGELVLGSQTLEAGEAGEGQSADGRWRIENGKPPSIHYF